MLQKIISGGQTGVDRSALDACLKYKFPCGGWCPAKRRAEDGFIPNHYPLIEMSTKNYLARTHRNVEDSDGTLVITCGSSTDDGTKKTIYWAYKLSKPCLIIDLKKKSNDSEAVAICKWINMSYVRILNVAGPRESKCPGIGYKTCRLIGSVLVLSKKWNYRD